MASSEPFIYTGQSAEDIPEDVTHVRVDPSVKEIGEYAFRSRRHLRNVELCEGLESIYGSAFAWCTSLERIRIPSTVKGIDDDAFWGCSQLMNVELREGLKRIGTCAFAECTSLASIVIPSTIKVIDCEAFGGCSQLRSVELCEGLERIDYGAFQSCTSLQRIVVPSTVYYIAADAFNKCTSLVEIEFCNEIEQFVNEASLHWWNNGVSEESLRTYYFLARHNIPSRLDTIGVQTWKDSVHIMLRRIPEMMISWHNNKYFDLIDSRLSNYENLQYCLPILELALWKATIMEQSNSIISNVKNDMKLKCRVISLSMFSTIFPNVISFLHE